MKEIKWTAKTVDEDPATYDKMLNLYKRDLISQKCKDCCKADQNNVYCFS